ncbi:hypothetical protein BDP81DRAFT_335252 [Colletotrichum phormii]|uniref:Pyranose:oxygen 2-oxidoreductase n=1 Tax=Colletotrichum phormii TaxID=359342 RepID=A0AAI9ZD84_9PEZI|nr:uncharacterized protein BDP81DRAFT_335252 [Colletotrichum phormii]KAK1622117.1 hypothetical protein BDP81DRAFT_335252 [Colletotrichum phormii]
MRVSPVKIQGYEGIRLEEADVLVVGSGPIGAVFSRTLVENGRKVLMIDVGNQETKRIGDHKKNSVAVQRDISLFTKYVSLTPFIKNGQNPNQKAVDNLPAAAATRLVGGMGGHWTCCTPREHKDIERSDLFSDSEWNDLYTRAEKLFWTDRTLFDKSIRGGLVKSVLTAAYEKKGREVLSMPLSGKRSAKNEEFVEWGCTATILGDELSDPSKEHDTFELRANSQCVRLIVNQASGEVEAAEVENLLGAEKYLIQAKKYIICAGAVLTPGILWNSGGLKDTLPALGRYLTEQPMAFCQIVLKKTHVLDIASDSHGLGWETAVNEHKSKFPNDPLPIPFNDPDPQVYFPLTNKHRWHTQIHRDAFGYGEVPSSIDQRLVVDLRWFGYTEPSKDNYVEFSTDVKDQFGMPQPTFHYTINDSDAKRCSEMITDMVDVARNLGGFLPGAEPKYLAPGSALHICGTYRAGHDKKSLEESKKESVVDRFGRVWGQKNLVLGGCGIIPTQNACNPTLTAAAFALAAADQMIKDLDEQNDE